MTPSVHLLPPRSGLKLPNRIILCFLVTLTLAAVFCFSAAARDVVDSGTCGDSATWTLYNDGELVIGGAGEMTDYDYGSAVPWYSKRNQIQYVTINNGITSVGSYSFYNNAFLTNVDFANSLRIIGSDAFYGCKLLSDLVFNTDLQSIGSRAFYGCTGLTSVSFNEDLKSIGGSAFSNCTGLTSVSFNENLAVIGSGAFYGCTNLNSVTFNSANAPTGTLNSQLFVSSPQVMIYYPAYAARYSFLGEYYSTSPTEMLLFSVQPSDIVTGVGGTAVFSAEALGENLSYQWYYQRTDSNVWRAVSEGGNTSSYTLIAAARHNGYVYKCVVTNGNTSKESNRVRLTVTDVQETIYTGECGPTATWELHSNGELIINGTGAIYDYALGGAPWYGFREQIRSIELSRNITEIGNSAFYDLDLLTSIDLRGMHIGLRAYSFSSCNNLVRVTAPDQITTFDSTVFPSTLQTMVLPASVEGFRGTFFTYCHAKEFICEEGETQQFFVRDGSLFSMTNGFTRYDSVTNGSETQGVSIGVPQGQVLVHYSDSGESTYSIPDEVVSIGEYAFANCRSLRTVNFGDSLVLIDNFAFHSCNYLSSLTFNDTLLSIGRSAFQGCPNVREIHFNDKLQFIGDSAFTSSIFITEITIPRSVKMIGSSAFSGCRISTAYFTSVDAPFLGRKPFQASAVIYYPDSSIGYSTPTWNGYHAEPYHYILPHTLVETGDCGSSVTWSYYMDGELVIEGSGNMYDFIAGAYVPWIEYSDSIRKVSFFGNVTSVGAYAFSNNYNPSLYPFLKEVVFCDSIITIGDCAFMRCSDIQEVTFGAGLQSIGKDAFGGCTSLNKVIFNDSIETIGKNAFDGCCELRNVRFSSRMKIIGDAAFYDCPIEGSISFGDELTTVGDQAFYGSDLSQVCFGKKLTSIGQLAFACSSNLRDITFEGNAPSVGVSCFNWTSPDMTIFYLPTATGFTSPAWNGYPCAPLSEAPVITAHPVSLSVGPGQSATFAVTAIGGNLSYRWYYLKPGATVWRAVSERGTSATYTLTAQTRHNGYLYKCVVTNGTDESESGTALLTVGTASVPVTSVTVAPATLALNVNQTAQLTATVLPENATDKTVTWTSSDPFVAFVDENGLVTAVGAGRAVITTISPESKITATCDVSVTVAESQYSFGVLEIYTGLRRYMYKNTSTESGQVYWNIKTTEDSEPFTNTLLRYVMDRHNVTGNMNGSTFAGPISPSDDQYNFGYQYNTPNGTPLNGWKDQITVVGVVTKDELQNGDGLIFKWDPATLTLEIQQVIKPQSGFLDSFDPLAGTMTVSDLLNVSLVVPNKTFAVGNDSLNRSPLGTFWRAEGDQSSSQMLVSDTEAILSRFVRNRIAYYIYDNSVVYINIGSTTLLDEYVIVDFVEGLNTYGLYTYVYSTVTNSKTKIVISRFEGSDDSIANDKAIQPNVIYHVVAVDPDTQTYHIEKANQSATPQFDIVSNQNNYYEGINGKNGYAPSLSVPASEEDYWLMLVLSATDNNYHVYSHNGILEPTFFGAGQTVWYKSVSHDYVLICNDPNVIPYIPVTGLTVNNRKVSLALNQTVQLTTTIVPDNATYPMITWISDAPAIASVSDDGIVTGRREGTTTIFAVMNNGKLTASCSVTVTAPVTVTTSPQAVTVAPGEYARFTAAANGENLSYQWFYLKPGDTEWNVVKTNGTAATYTLRAQTRHNGYIYKCVVSSGNYAAESLPASLTVTAASVPVISVSVTPTSLALNLNQTAQLTAAVLPENASDKSVTWTSDNPFVAFVDENGLVTATGAGSAVITAVTNEGKLTATCSVTVTVPVPPITVTTSPQAVIVAPGEYARFTAAASGENLSYQWFYLKPGDTEWNVVKTNGTAATYTLRAQTRHNGYIYKCVVSSGNYAAESLPASLTVAAASVPVTSVTVTPATLALNLNQTAQLTATVLPENASDKSVTWTSDNPFVAFVDENGAVTATGAGSTVVTAISNEGKLTATCSVTVTAPITITTQPQAVTVAPGEYARFTAGASGENLSYQWFYLKPGENVWSVVKTNGSAATYVLRAQERHNGYIYKCVVTDGVNTAESEPALLTVVSGPSFTMQPADVTVPAGQTATFAVAVSGQAVAYQWFYLKPGTSVWVPVQNGGASDVYTLSTRLRHNGYVYRCLVTFADGTVLESGTATLTVQ